MKRKHILINLIVLVLMVNVVAGCSAQDTVKSPDESKIEYPTKPVTFVVPMGAGGGTDTRIRLLAKYLEEHLGQPIVVENKGGGGGSIAANLVAKSKPDGYTLFACNSSPMVVVPLTMEVPYDPINDFEYVCQTFAYQRPIAAYIDAPFKTFEEMIEYGKKNPGELKVAIGDGAMGEGHVYLAGLFNKVGVEVNLIPYDSAAEAGANAAGGHVHAAIGSAPGFASLVSAGKLRPLLSSYADESDGYPGLKEYGIEELEYAQRNGIMAPKGTPQEIQDIIKQAVQKAIADPDFIEQAEKIQSPIEYLNGQEWLERTKQDIAIMKPAAEILNKQQNQ